MGAEWGKTLFLGEGERSAHVRKEKTGAGKAEFGSLPSLTRAVIWNKLG